MNAEKSDSAAAGETGIDHILATEEELLPSSGFLASVMERVHEEAAAPQPLAFPWVRAVPGVVLAAGVFGWGGFELVRYGVPALREVALATPHISTSFIQPMEGVGWVALGVTVSFLSWLLSRRLAGRSGLL